MVFLLLKNNDNNIKYCHCHSHTIQLLTLLSSLKTLFLTFLKKSSRLPGGYLRPLWNWMGSFIGMPLLLVGSYKKCVQVEQQLKLYITLGGMLFYNWKDHSQTTQGSLPKGLPWVDTPKTLVLLCTVREWKRASSGYAGSNCTLSPGRKKVTHSDRLPSFELHSIGPLVDSQQRMPSLVQQIPGASMDAPAPADLAQ